MSRAALVLLVLVLGGLGYIRLAPSDPAVWHVSPRLSLWDRGGPWDEVVGHRNGASLRLRGEGAALLARLAEVAEDWPRTTRLAGSLEEGRITWITRSRLFGFPDYVTAEARPDGLYLWARQRFGNGDLGVNRALLQDWLNAM